MPEKFYDDGTADEIELPDGTRLGKVTAKFSGSPRHVAMGLAPALGVPGFMRKILALLEIEWVAI